MNTDGLTNMVPIKDVYDIVIQDSENIANDLIEKANQAGGLDNITTVIIKM